MNIPNIFDQETFAQLHRAGFINPKFFIYREIYLWVQAQMQTHGLAKKEAVMAAELKFSKNERTIWRALNSFDTVSKK